MCFAGGHRNDRTSTIPIVFCLFGFITGSPPSLARLRLSGRRRSFAGTVLGFERIGAGDHAIMLTASRRSTFLSFQRLHSGSSIVLSSYDMDDEFGCRLA